MTGAAPTTDRGGWAGAWPDALAFAVVLGLAWFRHWETTDLVWSLWLSSLVVGYATIVWSIFGTGIFIAVKAWSSREMLSSQPLGPMAAGAAVLLFGGLFMLAFFTVHFGGFHYVHSVFLSLFFPVGTVAPKSFPGWGLYWEVLQRYWWFLPAAAMAERHSFRLAPPAPAYSDTSVTAAAIAARKARNAGFVAGGDRMFAPYKNVMRMHLLIFFFAFAHFANLENFLVYAVVYAAYFFPWRLVRKQAATG